MRGLKTAFLIALLATLPIGCRFSRDIVNPNVRDIDVSWIEPGKTSRQEVIDRLGFPPTVKGLGGVTKDSFRWTTWDTFTMMLEAGYIVTPTLERGSESFAEDVLVKFNETGVVSLVSRTRTRDGKVELVEWRESGR